MLNRTDLRFIQGELNQALIDLERIKNGPDWQKTELIALAVCAINNVKIRLNLPAVCGIKLDKK